MKTFLIALCSCLSIAVANAQTHSDNRAENLRVADQSTQVRLRLTTGITKERYSLEAGSAFLRLTLTLTYTNVGTQPILLDKKSSFIYRAMVSRNLKSASAKKYEYVHSSFYADFRAVGVRTESAPEEAAFVKLNPGESYSLEKDFGVQLYDGTKDDEDMLRPGNHFLQVGVMTWYYLYPPDTYREQWRDKGYLWSQNVTSIPMPFLVKKPGSKN